MRTRPAARTSTRLAVAIRTTLLALPLVGLLAAPTARAEDDPQPATYALPTYNDWGGTGLWQTPDARMAPTGEFAFTLSHVTPYTRYNFLLQPFSWLQVAFRYSDINNRPYGPVSLSGNQTLKDKSIDAKLRLWRESRYLPAVSVGIRDLAGTGLFSGEYVVANKRFGPIDASLGLGWGYVGARGNLDNPLDFISDRFRTRPDTHATSGGQFGARNYFRGPTALFGGISWQTPIQKLIVKLEYDGNDYQHEPHGDNQKQRTPWNLGAVYRLNDNVDFSAAIERGNTALFSLTLHSDLATIAESPKPLDPPPPKPVSPAPTATPVQVDWQAVSKELESNAGIAVSKIARRGSELVVTGSSERYYYSAKTLGRMSRVLDQYLGPDINWYTLESTNAGMPIIDSSVDRKRFDALIDHDITFDAFQHSVERDQPLPQREQVLYQAPLQHFHGGFSLGVGQSVGGPNAFVLYQVNANYGATYFFTPNIWWAGTVSANLINNYDKFTYDAPSNLPRVRTYVREYLTSSRVTMPLFQLTAARRVAPDWYAMAYGGMLESMFGGVGGEVLYRPFGQHWAIGADINWVKQRGFDQDFSFRNYHVVTGQVTGYFDTSWHDVLVKLSLGRYLAGDKGGTIDVSRHFRNGVRIGAYATFTNVSAKQFGEGSFDKGIYISIPFDLLLPGSTQTTADVLWQPLLRDGGARLNRAYTLYDLTGDRNDDNFYENLQQISH